MFGCLQFTRLIIKARSHVAMLLMRLSVFSLLYELVDAFLGAWMLQLFAKWQHVLYWFCLPWSSSAICYTRNAMMLMLP